MATQEKPAFSGASSDVPRHFPESGRVGALINDFDWSLAPIGPPANWPPPLIGTTRLMLAAPVPMIVFWGQDHVAIYNDAYAEVLGDRHPQALGGIGRETWGHVWHIIGPLIDKVRRGEPAEWKSDEPFPTWRGGVASEAYYDISFSPVPALDGTIGGVLGIVYETTERVRAARALAAERERLTQMFEQAPSFMALLREPGHIYEFANPAYHQLVGHRQLIGRSVGEALPEVIGQGVVRLLDEVAKTGRTYRGDSVSVMLDRRQGAGIEARRLDLVYQPILDEDGRVTGIFIEGSDVTDRARAEAQLALSESSLRLATEVAEVGTWDLDLETNVLVWSDRTRAMFGLSPDAPCSMDDFYAGLHPDDLAATSAAFATVLDPVLRATYDVEYRTIGREDGVIRWVAAKGRGIFEEGRCVRAIGTALDITGRKLAQEALRESEERFRTLADSAPALIWMCDEKGQLIFANRWHEETFGRPADELMGGGWQRILHPGDAEAFTRDFDAAFAARAPFSRDVRVIDRHGATRWLHSEARPRQTEGRFVGYVGCDVDITDAHLAAEALERGIAERTSELAASNSELSAQIEERERVEATLRQMQRLEAIGQLTSGVAHDFNNLLTVVIGNLDIVARSADELGLDEKTVKRLGYMRSAADRGATLTAQLLAFSRRQRLEARPVDLNDSVAGMRDLIQSSMGGSVRLRTELAEGLWPALVDPTQIELIILNLAINARDAMEVGGSLHVSTANVTLGEPGQSSEPAPGDYVMIAVADNGSGMTPEVRAKAFEPFFTTKEIGKGSGLGLAQVYGFAKQSGGGVGIETEVGRGTTVRVYLPRAPERRRTPRAQGGKAAPPLAEAAGCRMLLVDDDAAVREVTASQLIAMGATVLEADGGAQALDLLHAEQGRFDLLVLDFAMPGMNGADVAAAVRPRWPDLPILFVTGYADLTAIASVSTDRVVQKPFRDGELQRKVAKIVRDRAAAA